MLEGRARFSRVYCLWVVALILVVDSVFFPEPQVPEIAYRELLDRVGRGEVATSPPTIVATPAA